MASFFKKKKWRRCHWQAVIGLLPPEERFCRSSRERIIILLRTAKVDWPSSISAKVSLQHVGSSQGCKDKTEHMLWCLVGLVITPSRSCQGFSVTEFHSVHPTFIQRSSRLRALGVLNMHTSLYCLADDIPKKRNRCPSINCRQFDSKLYTAMRSKDSPVIWHSSSLRLQPN